MKVIQSAAVLGLFSIVIYPFLSPVFAETQNVNFQVNVQEVLSVSVTTPDTWAEGNIDTFLVNKIGLSVLSNNSDGFTATMSTSVENTALTNTAKATATIPTLDQNYTRTNFPTDKWGYSLDDSDSGIGTSTYSGLRGPSNPITIISNNESLGTGGVTRTTSKDIYFGAKASIAKASGTYSNTIVFNVVSGTITETNPVTPTNPATPIASNDPVNPAYDSTNNRTVYTTRTTSGGGSGSQGSGSQGGSTTTTTTTTDVVSGDARAAYSNPAGVTEETTKTNISDNSTLTTGLAAVAGVAAVVGTGILVVTRRNREDDNEDY